MAKVASYTIHSPGSAPTYVHNYTMHLRNNQTVKTVILT